MLFSPHVKTRPEDFYNYKKELHTLLTGIQDPLTRMIAVKGIRRIGKSSLLRVGLGMAGKPYILFDVRSIGEPTLDSIYEVLRTGLEEALSRISPLRSVISKIEGLEVSGFRVRIRERRHTILYNVFRALDEASPQPGGLVVAIDEAQYLSMIRGFPKVLAHVYDYMTGLKVVLTGSEVGLLDRLLGKRSPDAPLYGRPVLEIHMNRLPRGESVSFLEQGFQELGVSWSREKIEEAVDRLDGIPGWLTFYGYQAHLTGSHDEALSRAVEAGASLAARELEEFLAPRKIARARYLALLRCLSARPMRWSMLRRCMEAELGTRLANPQLYRYLGELLDYGFIEKGQEGYRLADPLLAVALERLR